MQLDNNLIETIENLSHLVNLQWLDLSFNNITKIEGLSDLTQLRDLCLVNNFISKIENLEGNTNLQVLSLGNNCIEAIDDILYLRQFSNLQALNLKGNPVYDREDFKVAVFAYCNSLKFLDYERIKSIDIKVARDEKQAELLQLEEKEHAIREKKELEKIADERAVILKKANIAGVETVFQDMIREDSEMTKLKNLPNFEGILKQYEKQINDHNKEYINQVLKTYKNKENEDIILNKTLTKLCFVNETESIEIIDKFIKIDVPKFESMLNSIPNKDTNNINAIKQEIKDILLNVRHGLMDLEMTHIEKMNFVINVYEDRIVELMKVNLSHAESYFANLQNLETNYFSQLQEIVGEMLEKIKSDGIDSILPNKREFESLRNMLQDRDAINNCVTVSHDNHVSHIGRLEDSVRDREEKEKKEKIETKNDNEYQRNRQRVSEISIFVEKFAKQFNITIDS